jgi:hypothetical protein
MGMAQVGLDIITDLSSPTSLVSPSHLQLKSLVFFLSILTDTLRHSLNIVFDTFLLRFFHFLPNSVGIHHRLFRSSVTQLSQEPTPALYSHNPLYPGLFNRHLDFILKEYLTDLDGNIAWTLTS